MFYPAAKVILQHPTKHDTILIVKRHLPDSVSYEPVGGRLNIDFERKISESIEECAIREVQEEIGLIISLERYIGSYYLFWTTEDSQGCSCSLFVGTIVNKDSHYKGNPDTEEEPLEPVWVSYDDILSKKIIFNPAQIGLEKLVLDYFQKRMRSDITRTSELMI